MMGRGAFGRRVMAGLLLCMSLTGVLEASKRILVDLTHQIAIAYQDGQVKFYGRISSGKPGRETPTGTYFVREKDIDHVSNLWPKPNGGAKMHYMLRITRDGVAMHLGPTPDYPASHGCIRMQDGFAQRMYAWAEKWTKVDIIGKAPAHSPAVALPAYARSTRILRRSIGGGTRGPLAALSSNPKDRIRHAALTAADTTSRPARPAARNHHRNPLETLSSNSRPRIKPHTRKPHKRPKRKRKPRHLHPLKAISSH